MSSSLRLLLNAVVIFPSWLQPEHTHPGQTWNMTTFFKLSLSTWLLPSSITLVQLIWFILNFLIHFHCYQTAFCFEIRAVLDLFWRFPKSGCVWLNKVDSITQHMIVHISDHIDKTSWGKAGNYSCWGRDEKTRCAWRWISVLPKAARWNTYVPHKEMGLPCLRPRFLFQGHELMPTSWYCNKLHVQCAKLHTYAAETWAVCQSWMHY